MKLFLILFGGIIFSTSCSNQSDKEKIQELETRLIATEAQLWNVESELARCANDNDSLKPHIAGIPDDSLQTAF